MVQACWTYSFRTLHRADIALLGCCAAFTGLYWDSDRGFPCASGELLSHACNEPMGPLPAEVPEPGIRADQAGSYLKH